MAWQKSVVALAAAVVLPLTGVTAGSSVAAAPALPVGSSAAALLFSCSCWLVLLLSERA